MTNKGNILVVDDKPEFLVLIREMLFNENYSVFSADSGELALVSIENAIPELILLDVQMPGIDGYEVCRRIKANKNLKHIPIIFLTTLSDPSEKIKGLKLGAVDYIPKPIEKEELLIKIETHINLYKAIKFLKEIIINKEQEYSMLNLDYASINEEYLSTNEELRNINIHLDKLNKEIVSSKEKAEQSENRLRSTLDNLLEGCQIIDFNWRYLYINKTAEKHNQRPNEELIGNVYTEMWPGIETLEVYRIIKHCLEERIPAHIENVFVFPDNSVGWFDLSIQPVPEGVFILSIDITERKKNEALLHLNEQKFRNVFESSIAGKAITELNGEFRTNKAFCDMVGYTYGELSKLKWTEITHPDDIARDKKIVESIISGNLFSMRWEKRYIHKDGHTVWVDIGSFLERDADKKPLYFISTMFDITERKQLEVNLKRKNEEYESINEELRQINEELLEAKEIIEVSEQRFSSIFHLGPVAKVLTRSSDSIILDFNSASEKLFGYKREDVIEKHAISFDFWVDLNERQRVIELYLNQGFLHGEVFQFKSTIGKTGWASIYTKMFEINGENYLLNEFVDITDQHLSEEKIRKSEEKYKLLAENIDDVVWLLDINKNKFVYVSPSVFKLRGYTAEEVLSMPVESSLTPESNAIVKERLMETLKSIQNGEPYLPKSVELLQPCKDGSNVWTEVVSNLIFDDNGIPIQVIGVSRNISERKKYEQALLHSNALHRTLFDNNPIPMWVYDNETLKFLKVNDMAINKYGYSIQEFLSMTLKDIRPIEEIELLIGNIQSQNAIIQGSGPWKHKLKNGEIIFVDIHSHEILYNNKTARIVAAYDITEKVKATRALAKSEEHFRTLFEQALDGIFIADENGNYLDVNTIGCQMMGYTLEEFLKLTLVDILAEDQLPLLPAEIERLSRGGTFKSQWKFKRKNNSIFYGEIVSKQLPDGRLQGIVRDITERINAHEAIDRLNERISSATKAAQLGIWEWDIKNDILYWDNQMYELYGVDKDKFAGAYEAWLHSIHADDKLFAEEESSLAVKGEKEYDTEFRVIWPDKSVHYLKAKGEVFKDEDNNPIRMLGVNFDITNQKQADEEIKKLNDTLEQRVVQRTVQLEEANKELEAFSYSVSHDLRAPLRHISGFADLLSNRFNDTLPEQGKHYLQTITTSAHQMGELIDDLLQFSRTGRKEMNQIYLDMNVVMREAMNAVTDNTNNRTINWNIDTLPNVWCDFALLRIVWVNLLSNAIKYTKEREITNIEIGFKEEASEFIFFVSDNGAGFDMKYANNLFGVFTRLHTSDQFEGTGIGLANVKRIVIKHGGRTWAEAELNKGATFYFSLPKLQVEV